MPDLKKPDNHLMTQDYVIQPFRISPAFVEDYLRFMLSKAFPTPAEEDVIELLRWALANQSNGQLPMRPHSMIHHSPEDVK